jgi:hypothetical protein
MAGPTTELTIAMRFSARALGRRIKGEAEPQPDLEAFEAEMERTLAALPGGVVRSHHWLTLPASEPPWRDTGVLVSPEAEVSYFAVGILQKEVDFPIEPDSEISWDWTVDALPGLLREDTLPSHDYLSLAIEFDNGWDLSYYWSTALPVKTGYVCPLPNWKHREYHVVVRSGEQGLGQPQSERRNLHRDYGHYMGELGPPPKRIVRIWLIANSVFQRNPGRCSYSNIRLRLGDRELVVL